MPTVTSFTHYLFLSGTASGTTLSWTSALNQTGLTYNLTDVDDDLDVDQNDYFINSSITYSGFHYEAPNGLTYPIFGSDGQGYYIPYNSADYDLASTFSVPGSTMLFQENDFEPTGIPVCLLTGTAIATPSGPVAVEDLRPGDTVLTADGRAVPVRFVGRQTIATRFGPPERLRPVRIKAGALGEGLPHRDLTLTQDHALLIDGVLCQAGALVNGVSILAVPLGEVGASYTVYHVETDAHEVILAEGAPAETFVDHAGRQTFDNHADYGARHGAERAIAEMPYPRVTSTRQLPPAIRRRLASRPVAA